MTKIIEVAVCVVCAAVTRVRQSCDEGVLRRSQVAGEHVYSQTLAHIALLCVTA